MDWLQDMERLRAWAGSARDGTGPPNGCEDTTGGGSGRARLNTGRVEGTTGGRGWARLATGGVDTTAGMGKLMRGSEATLASMGSTPN